MREYRITYERFGHLTGCGWGKKGVYQKGIIVFAQNKGKAVEAVKTQYPDCTIKRIRNSFGEDLRL